MPRGSAATSCWPIASRPCWARWGATCTWASSAWPPWTGAEGQAWLRLGTAGLPVAGAVVVDESSELWPLAPLLAPLVGAPLEPAAAGPGFLPAAALTRSFSSLPTLKKGRRLGLTATVLPVRGLRPWYER